MSDTDIIYKISAKDHISHVLDHANERAEIFHRTLERVESYAEIFGAIWGAEKVVEYFNEAGEEAHKFELAERNLASTMRQMGTYSEEAQEKTAAWAESFQNSTGIHEDRLLKLSATMQMVNGVSGDMSNRAIAASANIAAKTGKDVESVSAIMKRALIDPSSLGRAAKTFGIDPAEQAKIEALGAAGQTAAARLELISEAERKAGDFAKEAFNLDPLGRYELQMYKNKVAAGKLVEQLKGSLAPALEYISQKFGEVVGYAKSAVHWYQENEKQVYYYSTAVGILTGAYMAFNLWQKAVVAWEITKWSWTMKGVVAQAMQTLSTWASIGAFVALMPVIFLTTLATEGWAAAMASTGVAATTMWAAVTLGGSVVIAALVAAYYHSYRFQAAIHGMVAAVREFGHFAGRIFKDVANLVLDVFRPWRMERDFNDLKSAAAEAGTAMATAYKTSYDSTLKNLNTAAWKEKHDKEAGKRLEGAQGTPGEDGKALVSASKATGTKAITINIAINGGLVHEMKIITNTFGESIEEIEQKVANVLLRAVNDASLHAAI